MSPRRAAVVLPCLLLCATLLHPAAAAAQATGVITGTVRDAATGLPLSGVGVNVFDSVGLYKTTAVTDLSGVYAVSVGAAADYFLSTRNSAGYEDQLHAGLPCPNGFCAPPAGARVRATNGGSVVIDFSLAPGGTIIGTVTAANSTAGLAGITVAAFSSLGATVGVVQTNAGGSTRWGGLGPALTSSAPTRRAATSTRSTQASTVGTAVPRRRPEPD